MTQKKEILAHLQSGKSITPIEALNEYGCFRLADRIFVLKGEGHSISKELVTHPETNKRFARYWMEPEMQERDYKDLRDEWCTTMMDPQ